MQKFISNESRHTKLADILLEKVSDRKIKLIVNPAMLCAVYLDPRYCSDLSSCETKIAKLTLEKFHEKWMQRSESIQMVTSDANENGSYEEYRAAKRKRLSLPTSEVNQASDANNIALLFEKYENDLPQMRDGDSILAHWEDRKEADPKLYQLASMVNTIPPTQVTVERTFSILGLIYNARRTRLSPDLLERILLINLNKDMVSGINAEDVAELGAQ